MTKPAAAPAPAPHSDPSDPYGWVEPALRAMLIKSRSELQETTAQLDSMERTHADQIDMAAMQEAQDTLLRAQSRLRHHVRQIEDALRRLADGSYGICEVSGDEIDMNRLKANPLATRTLEMQEREEKRRARGI